jgi:hypothetical protein
VPSARCGRSRSRSVFPRTRHSHDGSAVSRSCTSARTSPRAIRPAGTESFIALAKGGTLRHSPSPSSETRPANQATSKSQSLIEWSSRPMCTFTSGRQEARNSRRGAPVCLDRAGLAVDDPPLIPSKSTASGRVTRTASSDPACILREIHPGLALMRAMQEWPTPSIWDSPSPHDEDGLSPVNSDAPNGGYLTQTAPLGGLPNTSASGRGWLLNHQLSWPAGKLPAGAARDRWFPLTHITSLPTEAGRMLSVSARPVPRTPAESPFPTQRNYTFEGGTRSAAGQTTGDRSSPGWRSRSSRPAANHIKRQCPEASKSRRGT